MKVYKKDFKEMFFEFSIENMDDLWLLSLFISEGDRVGCKTTRRFRAQEGDDSEKKSVFIRLRVKNTKLELDTQCLKVIGVIESGFPEEYVPVGQHHSFELHIGDKISINKTNLFEMHKKILAKITQEQPKSNIYLAVLDDDSCIIATLNETRYNVVTEIFFKGSGKKDSSTRDISRREYFDSIVRVLVNSNFDKCIIGGPGFEKENLRKYIFEKQPKELQSKFIFAHTSSPGISGIRELVRSGQVKKILGDINIQKDSDLIDDFLLHLSKNKPVTYGLAQVKEALDKGQLKKVLISDKFFHENFTEIKNLLLKLEDKKIEYHILNSETEPGKILDSMTGIAAFLYY